MALFIICYSTLCRLRNKKGILTKHITRGLGKIAYNASECKTNKDSNNSNFDTQNPQNGGMNLLQVKHKVKLEKQNTETSLNNKKRWEVYNSKSI